MMDQSQWMTHRKAKALVDRMGPAGAKQYLRLYFRNLQLPTSAAVRRLEFALFFFPEALSDEPPEFHLDLFDDFASPLNSADAAPRGHAKTTIGSVEIIYRIVNLISHFILPISDTYSQARDIVDNVRSELDSNNLLRWVYGDLSTDWHWTSGSFTTITDVRVTARGSNMKVRGLKYKHWRPDYVPIDDLENDEAVVKPERREKLLNWVKRAVLPAMASKNSKIAIVGTVLHDDSLLNNALKGEKGFGGWQRRKFSALNTREDGTVYSLWPSKFPVENLVRMRDDPSYERYLGPLVFSQEMQNEAIDDRARIIKRDWIYGSETKPNTYSLTAMEELWLAQNPAGTATWVKTKMKQIVMAVDPAISEKTTADYFAMVVIGIDEKGEIWILDIFRDRIADIDEQVRKIIEFAAAWKPDRIKVESVAYQAGLARQVQRIAAEQRTHLPIFKVVPDKDKFRRAVIHSANFAGNLVHVRTDHPLSDAFIQELLDFPMAEHDDMFDAYMHAAEDQTKRYKARTFASKPQGF